MIFASYSDAGFCIYGTLFSECRTERFIRGSSAETKEIKECLHITSEIFEPSKSAEDTAQTQTENHSIKR